MSVKKEGDVTGAKSGLYLIGVIGPRTPEILDVVQAVRKEVSVG